MLQNKPFSVHQGRIDAAQGAEPDVDVGRTPEASSMAGALPEVTTEANPDSVDAALAIDPDHISAYALIVERGLLETRIADGLSAELLEA